MTIEPGTTMREWEKRHQDSAAASIEVHNEPPGSAGLDRTCVKCGVPQAKVRHHTGTGWSSGCARDSLLRREWDGEHLHLQCQTCGYEWSTAPLDAVHEGMGTERKSA